MTPDLTYLTLTAGLCLILWIPYIGVMLVQAKGLPPVSEYTGVQPRPAEPKWVARSYRAHMNLVENIGPFAALVLVAHVAGAASETTALGAAIFFWARLVQVVVHLAGIPYVRTLAFAVGWIGALMIFWEIMA